LGPITKAKNIKANLPKILRPTHFSGMKDIKADKFGLGLIPRFFLIGVVSVNIWYTDLLENKVKTLKASKVTYSKYKS
jgi:hypothetical protein